MMLLLFATLSLAAFAHSNHLHLQCPHEETHLHPITLSEMQGKWDHIVSAYKAEELYNADKQMVSGWVEISTVDGVSRQKYVAVLPGQVVTFENSQTTFSEKDGHVSIRDDGFKMTSQVHKMSDDCIVFVMTNHTDSMSFIGNVLFCRTPRGNDADVEAFKAHSHCKNLEFIAEFRSYFNYAKECDSFSHMMDPLDHNVVTGKWFTVARASLHPGAYEGKNPWAEISWEGEELKFHQGHGTTSTEEEVEVKGPNIVFGKVNTTSMAFYKNSEECLLARTETHSKEVSVYLLTKNGKHSDSQIKAFHTAARCLSLPTLYKSHGAEVHEEEGSECNSMSHIVDVFVPCTISGKWQLVAKADSHTDPLDEEEDSWVEYSWDGEHLKIQEGHGTDSWTVQEVTTKGPKVFIGTENSACVTFHPTCKDCLLMKIKKENEVILKMYTKSGKLTASEIKTFKDKAHCVNLSNVLVCKSAKPHED